MPLYPATLLLSSTFLFALVGCIGNNTDNPQSGKIYSVESSSGKQELDLAKMYTQAIADYIRLVQEEYELTFDTLYFGKHVYGQPDDFPDIELPASIGNTNIQLVSPEQGERIQRARKHSFYINLIGWVDADSADFTFVTFSNGFAHQFDCFINYQRDSASREFVLESTRFEKFLYKE